MDKSFTAGRLIRDSLRHHRRIHIAVALGTAAATAVLTGALLVGDSMRGSLFATAMNRLGLDRVVWLVSPQNPLKDSRQTAPLADRMASARTFARGPHMVVSDFETRVGTTWTVDTLRALKMRHPAVHFVWLMGSDNLAGFHRWRGWTDIMRLMPVAVIARPGSQLDSRTAPAAARYARFRIPAAQAWLLASLQAPAWTYLTAPLNPRSSTAIRRAEALNPANG